MADEPIEWATDFALNHAGQILDYLSRASGPISAATAKAIKPGLAQYLIDTYERYRKIKTIINRSDPVEFSSLYVNQYIALAQRDQRTTIPDSDILTAKVSQHVILSGTAGTGKSMLMRYLLLTALARKDKPLPIFIELRKINEITSFKLEEFILSTIKLQAEQFSAAALRKLLEDGRAILLLDGYDEILLDKRGIVAQQISELARKYGGCKIVISSRPYEHLEYLDGFKIYIVEHMNLEQSLAVVEKLKYDINVKSKFAAAIKKTLHKTHGSFVSNPLLLSMMLLTFEQHASIPEKMHIFYEQAFETLFLKHDASKEMWIRKTYCNLQIDQFRNILSNFSAITYLNEQFAFSYADLMENLRRSIEIEEEQVDPENFLKDLVKSVCIVQLDGLYYTFTHRSFQEYFCAVFLGKNTELDLAAALDRIAVRQSYDGVLPMLLSMNTDRVEREWVVPTIREKINQIGPDRSRLTSLEFVQMFVGAIRVIKLHQGDAAPSRIDFAAMLNTTTNPRIWALRRLYKALREDKRASTNYFFEEDNIIEEKAGQGFLDLFSSKNGKPRRDFQVVIGRIDKNAISKLNSWLPSSDIYKFCEEFDRGLRKLEKRLKTRLTRKAEKLTDVLAIRRPPEHRSGKKTGH